MEHITLYREPGRYAGWPANYGIWAWGDEIVVGFAAGYHDPDGGFHARPQPAVRRDAGAQPGRRPDMGRGADPVPHARRPRPLG